MFAPKLKVLLRNTFSFASKVKVLRNVTRGETIEFWGPKLKVNPGRAGRGPAGVETVISKETAVSLDQLADVCAGRQV
jgi:hypothetical protein